MGAHDHPVVVDCKQCGRQGVGLVTELRRFGWRVIGEYACPACQGLSGLAASTTDSSPVIRSAPYGGE
jgi:hypothetical protein